MNKKLQAIYLLSMAVIIFVNYYILSDSKDLQTLILQSISSFATSLLSLAFLYFKSKESGGVTDIYRFFAIVFSFLSLFCTFYYFVYLVLHSNAYGFNIFNVFISGSITFFCSSLPAAATEKEDKEKERSRKAGEHGVYQ